MPIPDVMAFPIDLMQSVGDQIVADAQTLESDATTPIGQIKQTVGALPASMRSDLQ